MLYRLVCELYLWARGQGGPLRWTRLRRWRRVPSVSDQRVAGYACWVELEEWHRWWKASGARGLRVLLMASWDPIGVNGIAEASDEYDTYLGPLAGKLRAGADARAVCEYLADIQTQRIGLPATPDQLTDVGERVVGWYAVEMQR